LRVVMISHACTVAAYRRKLEEMAALPDIHLTLVVPPWWKLGPTRLPLEPGYTRGYDILVERARWNGRHHLHYYPSLGRVLARLKPDLLHVDEEPYDLVAWHSLRAARRLGIPVLFFTWQNLYRRFPPPFCLFERYVLRRAGGAIAGNHEAQEMLRRKGFAGPVFLIPQFGVDTDAFRRATPRQRPSARLRIGFAGRLVEEKGLVVLLQALPGLDGDWSLELLGDGPMRSQLASLANRLGVSRRVFFRGSVPSTAMPEHLSALDVLVLPSLTTRRWKEQFGRVLIEAMACEVAVVGSDSGEIPNVIGDAGIVVPEGNVPALRTALQRFLDEPGLTGELGRAGCRQVEEHYTQALVARRTVDAYHAILP